MRRVEGSTLVRHQREPKLLLSEVPRNRMGRLQTGNYVYLILFYTSYPSLSHMAHMKYIQKFQFRLYVSRFCEN